RTCRRSHPPPGDTAHAATGRPPPRLITFISIPTLALYGPVKNHRTGSSAPAATLQHLSGAGGANAAALITTGASHVAVYSWTFLLGQSLMLAINALLLGSLMYRSRLVPRAIPVLGLIGAPLLITALIAALFGGIGQYSSL